jgi:flagellar basal-body rod protein FlgC
MRNYMQNFMQDKFFRQHAGRPLLIALALTFVCTGALGSTFKPGPFGAKSTLLASPNAGLELQSKQSIATKSPGTQVDTKYNVGDLSKFNCADLRRAALKMAVHASNLANRNTSRTPEGGPYLRQSLVCRVSGAFCTIEKSSAHKMEMRPGHPDADPQGYVKLPDINAGAEFAGLNNAAVELRILASQSVCGAKSMELGSSIIVKYHADFEVVNDTMTFSQDGRLASWSRTTKDGQAQNLAFNSDGIPLGL